MSRNVLRKVTLASGCEIAVSVALTVDVFALSREERNFVFEMIDQLAKIEREVARPPTFEPISNIDTKANIDRDLKTSFFGQHLGPEIAALLESPPIVERDPKPANVIRYVRCKATDHDSKDCPIYSCGVDMLENVRPAEDVILETALALPDEPVQSWPTVTVKRESIAEKTAAAPALKPSGAIVDSAKNLDAFRAAAKDRRDKLAKEAARAKERLAAARARTEELEAQRKARQGRCSVAPPERDPVLARANREKLPERNELPVPSSTWVL